MTTTGASTHLSVSSDYSGRQRSALADDPDDAGKVGDESVASILPSSMNQSTPQVICLFGTLEGLRLVAWFVVGRETATVCLVQLIAGANKGSFPSFLALDVGSS